MEMTVRVVLIGMGATLVMDLWNLLLKRLFGMRSPDYGMVGRWIGHMPQGQFVQPKIAAAPPVRGERAIGWAAHYIIGAAYGGLLFAICGQAWVRQPSLGPALIVGVLTLIAPFFIMQPGMGMGWAASKAPKPNAARLRSLITHTIFGLGLFVTAWLLSQV